MDGAIIHETITRLMAVIMALMGFIGANMREGIKDNENDVKSLRDEHSSCELDLANFKTEVALGYSKEVNTQSSLGRIHDRLDTMSETMDNKFDNIQTDLKTIISKVK